MAAVDDDAYEDEVDVGVWFEATAMFSKLDNDGDDDEFERAERAASFPFNFLSGSYFTKFDNDYFNWWHIY